MTLSSRSRIGVFGGTFDPPHIGHMAAAVDARHRLGLDRMLMMVANIPWQKVASRPLTDAEDRYAMVAAAVDGVAGLEASRLEIDRGGASYTVDTLEELHHRHQEPTLFVVIGADAAAGIETWRRPEDVARLATLVVVDRPGSHPALPGGFTWERVEVPRLDISSTALRRRVSLGEPLDFLVPPGVVTCIAERRLYRGDE